MIKKKQYKIIFSIQIICLLLISGCAIKSIYLKEAKDLYRSGQYDKAVEYFEKALKERPKRTEIKRLLFRAKLSSYYHHLILARKLKDLKKKEEAIKEYRVALKIFPNNKRLEDEFYTYTEKKKVKKETFKSTIKPPVTLNVNTEEKVSLNLKSAPITKIFKMLGKSYKINIIFDKDFRDFVYNFEIENVGFYDVLNQLCLISNTKFRVLDPSSIIIYPNTVYKKRTFELQGVKIYYLSNIKAENAKKLLQSVFRGQGIMVQEEKDLNCLIVKASSNELMDVEKFINHIDKQMSEVELDIEILEVNRNFLRKIGLDLGIENVGFSAGAIIKEEEPDGDGTNGTGTNGQPTTIINVNDIKNTNFFLALPTASLDFLETDGNNKIIAKPNLRGIHGEKIKFMVGDEIPIPQTSYQAMAAGGISNIPMTQFTYKNVGVEIEVTPFVHNNNEVTLRIKLTINFISGKTPIGNTEMPNMGKREMENVIRLKEGEISIIGGFIRDEERKSLRGFPALSKIPVIGYLFGSSRKEIIQTDLIFSITPRIIKRADIKPQDLDPIWTNTLSGFQGAGRRELPEPGTPGPDQPRSRPRRRELNSIMISPSQRRVPANNFSYFTIRMSSNQSITSLSLSGSVSGGKATIEEMRTDFFRSDKVKVFKNHSGESFDLGYSFQDGAPRNSVLAQLKIKFLEKGNYTISIGNFNVNTKDKKEVNMTTSTAEVQVY